MYTAHVQATPPGSQNLRRQGPVGQCPGGSRVILTGIPWEPRCWVKAGRPEFPGSSCVSGHCRAAQSMREGSVTFSGRCLEGPVEGSGKKGSTVSLWHPPEPCGYVTDPGGAGGTDSHTLLMMPRRQSDVHHSAASQSTAVQEDDLKQRTLESSVSTR